MCGEMLKIEMISAFFVFFFDEMTLLCVMMDFHNNIYSNYISDTRLTFKHIVQSSHFALGVEFSMKTPK